MSDIHRKFQNCVEKFETNLDGGKIPKQLTDAVTKFKEDVNKIFGKEEEEEKLYQIDLTSEVIGLSKPQMTHWAEYVRHKMYSQLEGELMYKRGTIEMHPELIDQNLVEEYQRAELEKASNSNTQIQLIFATIKSVLFFSLYQNQLEKLKDEHVGRKPEDLVTPDLNIDIDAFNVCSAFIDRHLPLLTDYPPNINEVNEIEIYFSGVYFHRLHKALCILNEMVDWRQQDEMIGIELSISDNTVEIFPDTLVDPHWVSA